MGVRTAHSDGVYVLWWIGAGERADAEECVRGLKQCAREHGRKPHYVSVVCHASRAPASADARKGILSTVPEIMALCEHMHIVVEGNPFVNSVTRGMVAAAGVMPQFRGRVTVYDSLEQALQNIARMISDSSLPERVASQFPPEYTEQRHTA